MYYKDPFKYRFLDGVLPIWEGKFEDRDLQPQSTTARYGDGFMRMPFVPGVFVPGYFLVILNLPRKPEEFWISMKEYGTGMPFWMISTFCLPMKKEASRRAVAVMPPIRRSRMK
ncbi:MAG TPA: hypothetical protein DDW17_00275 [Deltaproteobacteria bacterium]|nr:hypothetical protein [Deltaproteobacteria bacterium]